MIDQEALSDLKHAVLWIDSFVTPAVTRERLAELKRHIRPENRLPRCLRAGNEEKALELLSELEARSKSGYVPSFWLGIIHMGLGDRDEAFRWLDKAYGERDRSLIYITVPPIFGRLGPDPRYQELLQKMGIEHLYQKSAPVRHLDHFVRSYPGKARRGFVVFTGERNRKLDDRITALSFRDFLDRIIPE